MAPQPYIAHPYSLLQTQQVIGRQQELNLLSNWVSKPRHKAFEASMLHLVAIGGMGKTALAWKWFNDVAPHELPKLAGRAWWSFYESDAFFENFVVRCLAYASGLAEKKIRRLDPAAREDQLIQLLDERQFLVVLDGLERILLAYARMDAAQMSDDDLDERTAHAIADARGLPANVRETYLERHRLRMTADPRAGVFLRRAARVRSSRILVTTRLFPADLQTDSAAPWPGCYAAFLEGLTSDDALNLWRALGVTGSREQLFPTFEAFGNYPLLVRALAGEVAGYRPAPRDFDRWKTAHPDFHPAGLPLKTAKTHVPQYALRGLAEKPMRVLHTLSAFRMPATWDTLCVLLAGERKSCDNSQDLDSVLTELEDRGLVGWDKESNRYDMHPIVRSVLWQALDDRARTGILGELQTYFDAVPKPKDWHDVKKIEDLTPAIELYNALVGLGRFEDAFAAFCDHLGLAALYRLGTGRQCVELLLRLFPDGIEAPPRLAGAHAQGFALNALAIAHQRRGEPGCSVALYARTLEVLQRERDDIGNVAVALQNLSDVLRLSGALHKAEAAARRALEICQRQQDRLQEAVSLQFVGLVLAMRGKPRESETALKRARAIFTAKGEQQSQGVVSAFLCQRLLWLGEPAPALPLAIRARELALVRRHEADSIRAARLHGTAALEIGDLKTAAERLEHTVTRARAAHLLEDELPALNALAEVRRQRQEFDASRELLEHVWAFADRGPYPVFHADALTVLSHVERDLGDYEAAIAAATRAFKLAWCDGPPFSYHHGLTRAGQQLAALGAPEPCIAPFDPARCEPMPEAELNPQDEFHV